MNRVPISEEERMSPYYKYFIRDMAPIPKEKLEMLKNNPLTPETALNPENINNLFKDGYLPGEFGWTRMKDGTLTAANITNMPGVTVEMFDWFFAWHGLEPMRYKIWDPEEHYYCLTQHPEKAKNSKLSMKERYWDTIHDVIEDIGSGKEKIEINFGNPKDIGFDETELKKFKGTIICGGNEKNPVIMLHFLRPTENGCELRTRFWMGYCVKDGKPQKTMFPPAKLIPESVAMKLLEHNVKEYTNLRAILPELYEEFKDEMK
ncbi:DAPG hydrolase family protein [Konateibacter massiliensis]|uniref:DAPG hydrolase family protein n=1 Tax=Konateibacter massiliensis TaxID=2002841 RepID=UPI000C151953|nr:phloretin hydrolase [Konateibacter massiliensis]